MILKAEPWFELYYFLEWYCQKWCEENLYSCDIYDDIWLSTGHVITSMLYRDFEVNALMSHHRNLMDVLVCMTQCYSYTVRESKPYTLYKDEYLASKKQVIKNNRDDCLKVLMKEVLKEEGLI